MCKPHKDQRFSKTKRESEVYVSGFGKLRAAIHAREDLDADSETSGVS